MGVLEILGSEEARKLLPSVKDGPARLDLQTRERIEELIWEAHVRLFAEE